MGNHDKWTDRWEAESRRLAQSIVEKDGNTKMAAFAQYAVLMGHMILSFVGTALIESDAKSTQLNGKKMAKHLNKMKRGDIHSTIRYVLLDYAVWRQQFEQDQAWVEEFLSTLQLPLREKKEYEDVKASFKTIKHSRVLLTRLGAGEQAYLEYLIDTVEETKHHFYELMDKRWRTWSDATKNI